MTYEKIGCELNSWESDPQLQDFVAAVKAELPQDIEVTAQEIARYFFNNSTIENAALDIQRSRKA